MEDVLVLETDVLAGPQVYGRTMRMAAVMARTQRRWERAPSWAADAAFGTAVVLAGFLTTSHGRGDAPIAGDRDVLALLLILAATLPYFVRSRAPLPVFGVTMLATGALMLHGYDEGMLPMVLMVGAYSVAARRPVREVVAAATLIGVVLVGLAVVATGFGASSVLASLLGFSAAIFVGWTMQARRDRIVVLESEQTHAAMRAAADERLRIAQELHDVVAHSLGVIAVQAGVGMTVIDSDPEEARRAFENISRTSRSSLAEIRGVLGMVRNASGAPTYTPAPGLGDVRRLAQEMTAAGLEVDVTVDGDIRGVPPGVELAAYRIVQEALTNTLRHAHAHRARVRLDGAKGLLCIEVVDDGRGASGGQNGGGHGLVGMRERAAVYGGSLDAGPAAGGGFRVTARLPYDAERVS
jgi:signal transduction histidine kinase